MNWELIHAITMLPGFFISPKSLSYRALCGISCAYHFCKSLKKRRRNLVYMLQRADLAAQLLVCLANAKYDHHREIIIYMMLIATQLNVKNEKQRRLHLIINGISILICNGFVKPSIYMWGMVFTCCVATNLTHIQIFHSAMHLFGHAAFSLVE